MDKIILLEKIATQVRRDLLRMIHAKKSGHPGGSLGVTDLLVCLYFDIMQHSPDNFTIDGKNQDLFFLSNGHTSAAWYSVLARAGYFPIEELKSFRAINSRLQGHPTNADDLPGIRIASGSLGQGLSAAAGAALAKKLNNDDMFVYCLCGDGEMQEGQIWEAIGFARAREIDNLILFVDFNGQQIDGKVDDILYMGNLKQKLTAFEWITLECNGNNIPELIETTNKAKQLAKQKRPIVVIMKTEMGMGVDFMMGTHKWHGVPPNDQQLTQALAQLPETIGDY